jgi:hypothetical protein
MYQVKRLKSITGHLKRSFLVLFTIMTLFFITGVAQADKYIDFEDYNLGELDEQFGWECETSQTGWATIQNEVIIAGTKTMYLRSAGGYGYCEKNDFDIIESNGKLSIKYYFSQVYTPTGFYLYLQSYASTPLPHYIDVARLRVYYHTLKALDNTIWVDIGDVYEYYVYNITIEWDLDTQKYRVKIDNNNFSNWLSFAYYDLNYPVEFINTIYMTDAWYGWVDDINLQGTECDSEHLFNCHTLVSCNNAGGFWDIVAQVCFKFENLISCGAGNNLQYCENETDCENNGGYWYNDFCYEAETSILDFLEYYNAHSDFDTPTSFVSSLAGFVSPFLQSAGNFLETFKNNFDITQATAKGYLLGSAISQARGYLDIVNDFFGGLPIAEMLLLFIIVIVLIVIVRVVIKIIHIVKP